MILDSTDTDHDVTWNVPTIIKILLDRFPKASKQWFSTMVVIFLQGPIGNVWRHFCVAIQRGYHWHLVSRG